MGLGRRPGRGAQRGRRQEMGSPGLRGGPDLLLSRGTFGYSSSRADVSWFSCEVNGRGGGAAAKANSWRIMMFVILNNVNNNYIHSIHRAGGGGAADPPRVTSAAIKQPVYILFSHLFITLG